MVPPTQRRLPHRRVLPVALALVAALALTLIAPTPASAAGGEAGTVFTLTNAERAKKGLSALRSEPSLDAAAQAWAEHLAATCTFEHSTSTWRSARTSGAGWVSTGENIAAGHGSAAAVMTSWMDSPGHRANILDSRYQGLGVGFATGGCYRTYWVQVFAIPQPGMKQMPGSVSVSGTATVGGTLTATAGGFPSGARLSWRWLSAGKVIPGATGKTYSPTVADAGRSITAQVVASATSYIGATVSSRATAAVSGGPAANRVGGSDRYATSAAIARAAYPSGASVAYVATGLNFPDALSAAPAAARADGPLLLTAPGALSPATAAALKALDPDEIVIVGGSGAVSSAVERSLKQLAPVSRVTGGDRYAVSRALASGFGTAPAVYLATGRDFPDALAAGAAAGAAGQPVILVDGKGRLDAATNALLTKLGTTTVRVVGGAGAVGDQIVTALKNRGLRVQRLSGGDRYQTAASISLSAFPSPGRAYLANGMNFPDALSGAAAAAAAGAPLLITPSTCLVRSMDAALTTMRPSTVTLLGGTGTLTAAVGTFQRC